MAHSSTLGVIEAVVFGCVFVAILLVQAGMYMAQRHVHTSSCSLHSIKSKETTGVKMFPKCVLKTANVDWVVTLSRNTLFETQRRCRTFFALYSNFHRPRVPYNHCLIDVLPIAQAKRPTNSYCQVIFM